MYTGTRCPYRRKKSDSTCKILSFGWKDPHGFLSIVHASPSYALTVQSIDFATT